MPIIHIQSLSYPGVDIFSTLTEAQLRNKLEPSKGIFIAESPKVIHVALNAGYKPLALLCEEKHIKGDAKDIIEQYQEMPCLFSRLHSLYCFQALISGTPDEPLPIRSMQPDNLYISCVP